MKAGVENHSVREAETLRPRLREGLRFTLQESGGQCVCVIEDPFASRFHRVGLAEYHFFRALDGTQTMATILARLARDGGGESFTEAEALQMVRWLQDQHLLAVESTRADSGREASAHALRFAATWLNPLVLKLPLARPDRFFTALTPALRGALGGFGLALWLLVVITGAAHVAMDWSRFGRDFGGIFARDNWLWLFLVWAGLKIAHEFGHGLFCKHFGAAVREIGLIFVLFVPMGYVDATASLGLASKWRRIMVACAGLYVEFFLAAVAAVVWAHTAPGALHTAAHAAVLTGSVVTLLFNANPLMRFDGYFVLSELLDLPNLATRGKNWTQRALTWLLTGARQFRPARPHTRAEWIVALYGIAAGAWQLVVAAGLLVGASTLLKGGGLGLAVVAGVAWIAVPLARFGAVLAESAGAGWRAGLRLALRGAVLVAIPAAALFVPFHRSVTSPGVVELAETHALRVECPGFVRQVLVRDGEMVQSGQLLLELTNDEAVTTLARRRLELAQQELRARMAYARGDVAGFQSEHAKSAALRAAVTEHERYLATLQIRAPLAGRVTNRQLAQMAGTFLQPGTEALRLGRGAGSDVKITISQADEPHWREVTAHPLRAKIAGRGGVFDAQLVRLEPRATRELPDPALTALAGGPLALRRHEDPAESGAHRGPEYELAEPHFTATAHLLAPESFSPGEMALVKFRSPRTATLWAQCQGVLARWLKRSTERPG
ncbi:MAG: site-2 protease family protein [Chthoniobacter sp.]|nr:site-2 protease family protein [Chthoniobacter sp.]